MKKALKILITVVLLVATLSSTAALAVTGSAKVVVSSMTVYNSSKKAVGSLPRGTSIKVTASKGSWIRFKLKGNTYYAKMGCVSFSKTTKAVTTKDAHFEFVTKTSWGKGTYYKATLAAGTTVYICGQSGKKYLVTNANRSAYGYIAKTAVSTK